MCCQIEGKNQDRIWNEIVTCNAMHVTCLERARHSDISIRNIGISMCECVCDMKRHTRHWMCNSILGCLLKKKHTKKYRITMNEATCTRWALHNTSYLWVSHVKEPSLPLSIVSKELKSHRLLNHVPPARHKCFLIRGTILLASSKIDSLLHTRCSNQEKFANKAAFALWFLLGCSTGALQQDEQIQNLKKFENWCCLFRTHKWHGGLTCNLILVSKINLGSVWNLRQAQFQKACLHKNLLSTEKSCSTETGSSQNV